MVFHGRAKIFLTCVFDPFSWWPRISCKERTQHATKPGSHRLCFRSHPHSLWQVARPTSAAQRWSLPGPNLP